jgi:hypothetical protein
MRRGGATSAVSRPVLRAIANELRLEHGSGVLSLLVVNKMRQELIQLPAGQPLVVIIDAIRNPEEVPFCSESWRRTLIWSPSKRRWRRWSTALPRARVTTSLTSLCARRKRRGSMILGEAGKDEPAHGHDIQTCIDHGRLEAR